MIPSINDTINLFYENAMTITKKTTFILGPIPIAFPSQEKSIDSFSVDATTTFLGTICNDIVYTIYCSGKFEIKLDAKI